MLSTQRLRILPKFVCVTKHHILDLSVLDCQENSAILCRMQTAKNFPNYPALPYDVCCVYRCPTELGPFGAETYCFTEEMYHINYVLSPFSYAMAICSFRVVLSGNPKRRSPVGACWENLAS